MRLKKIFQKLALDETDLDVIVVTDRENLDILEINPLKKIWILVNFWQKKVLKLLF